MSWQVVGSKGAADRIYETHCFQHGRVDNEATFIVNNFFNVRITFS